MIIAPILNIVKKNVHIEDHTSILNLFGRNFT